MTGIAPLQWLGPYGAAIQAGMNPAHMQAVLSVLNIQDVQTVGGALANGVNDTRQAIASLDSTVFKSGGILTFSRGLYRIASNLTIRSQTHFDPGAILVPDVGVVVTIQQFDAATGNYQVFDLSNGGLISLGSNAAAFVTPYWWGGVGDGVTDDYQAVLAAINTGRSINFRAATFAVSGPTHPASNTQWVDGLFGGLKWLNKTCLTDCQSATNWRCNGVAFDGNFAAYTVNAGGADKPWAIRIEASANISITGNIFKNFYRIGVAIGDGNTTPNVGVKLNNNSFDNIGATFDPTPGFGEAVAVLSVIGCQINGNTITNINGSGGSATAGIDLEPGSSNEIVQDVEVANNHIDGVLNAAGIAAFQAFTTVASTVNINVHDNTVRNTGTGRAISITQFGNTRIAFNYCQGTEGILVNRMQLFDAEVSGNKVYGTSVQAGLEFANGGRVYTIQNNVVRGVAGAGVLVRQDTGGPYDVMACNITGNTINAANGAALDLNCYNFNISGNTFVDCSKTSTTGFYVTSVLSRFGYVGGNTFVHTGANTVAGFINCAGTIFEQVQFGPNSFVAQGAFTPVWYVTTGLARRCPGVYTAGLPLAGPWQVGDVIYNSAPASGAFIGWVCTAAPNTWKTYGLIS